MLEQLLHHIALHSLCKTTDKILLAVSGGLDSMVMLHLLKDAGFRISVAHCNFQLRGAESLADEEFVSRTCGDFNIPLFVKRFDTENHAAACSISIQMAARELRYDFFDSLAREGGFDLIATAHHFDDSMESIFMNLIRGTGMDGLRGIAVKKKKLIRPMLFATREMILAYARENNIQWREDASNATDDYQRNFLRHQVIPRLVEMNPNFRESFRQTHERLLGARSFALAHIAELKSSAVISRDDKGVTLDIQRIRTAEAPPVLLWEIIKDLGFKYDQCRKITQDHQPGKIFSSDSHQLVVDRKHYIIDRKRSNDMVTQTIEKGQRLALNGPAMLVFRECPQKEFTLARDSSLGQLDADRLKFPLLWRKWQAGDYFAPLGMQAVKKVSDFLIDLKIPFNSKADITVLESDGEIVWIVGHRINDRYKVTPGTNLVLIIEHKDNTG